VVNRGKLGALAEFWHAGRSPQELIHVTIGTGVAAGIIHKGELYTGPSSSAGELGHTTILPDGPLCACGNRGCLQELVSESALVARAREALRDSGNTGRLLAERAGSHPEQLSAQDVLDAAHDGDEIALSVLREAAAYLGIAIANMINLLNPQRIVLGGPIGSASSMFCGLVREQVRKRAMAYPFSKVSIDQTSLGFDAGAVGASVLILKQAPALLLERPGGMLAGITMKDQSYDGS
jgi:glucokinase